MKTIFKVFILILTMSAFPLVAQEWSTEQMELIQSINEYTQASMEGDVDEIMSYFHADFIAWGYFMEGPIDRDSTQRVIEYNIRMFKQTAFNIQPIAIQQQDDMAIVHLNFQEVMRNEEDVDMNISGRWTATLVKQNDKWIFLCWTWIQEVT